MRKGAVMTRGDGQVGTKRGCPRVANRAVSSQLENQGNDADDPDETQHTKDECGAAVRHGRDKIDVVREHRDTAGFTRYGQVGTLVQHCGIWVAAAQVGFALGHVGRGGHKSIMFGSLRKKFFL